MVDVAVPACRETSFLRRGRTLAAKRWHEGGVPTFALHGWLDNANSFDPLAPGLPELDIVALDFAGHGRSDHRHPDVPYRGDFDIEDCLAVADELGWERFNLIGHSMGAEYGSQLAGLFPERVTRLVCIDGFADSVTPMELVEARRKSVARGLANAGQGPRVFPSVAAMADRVVAATGQERAAVMTLLQRGHKAAEGGVTWATDPRLRHDGMQLVVVEELLELAARTTAPTLVIEATQGQEWFRKSIARIRPVHPALEVVEIAGSHHLHMVVPAAGEVLAAIRKFLHLG